jgi:rod shape-determining protein MreC
MPDILSRHRPLTLLAGLILLQLLLLAFQIKREHDVRLVRYWAAQLLTPAERAGTWSFSKMSGMWSSYVGLRDTRNENQRLKTEVEQLRMRNRELESRAAEGQRLAALMNFREAHPEAPMIAAQVIGASADPSSHILFINRGDRDRLRRNLAVITPDGVVGKIVEVFPYSAQVLLINDKESGVGALFAGTRTHGVVKGGADSNPHMEYVQNDEKVQPGQAILTSGEDRIFPKDLPIGTVESAAAGNPFQVIRVLPAARLDRLEEVLVLMSQQQLAPNKTEEASSALSSSQNRQMGASQTAQTSVAGQKTPSRKPSSTVDASKAEPTTGSTPVDPQTAPPDNSPATAPNPPAPQP